MTTGRNLSVQAGCDDDNDRADNADLDDSNDVGLHSPAQSTPRQHDKAGFSWCVYVGIVLAGCALAALVLFFGIREQRNESKRRFELDGTFELLCDQFTIAFVEAILSVLLYLLFGVYPAPHSSWLSPTIPRQRRFFLCFASSAFRQFNVVFPHTTFHSNT